MATSADTIVRSVAAAGFIRGESPDECPFCGMGMRTYDHDTELSSPDPVGNHEDDCPYRMAVEYVAEHPRLVDQAKDSPNV